MRELRRLGADVRTFTVKPTDDLAGLSDEDRAEAATTVSLRPVSPLRLAGVHVKAIANHPAAWLATLRRALELRGPGARGLVWQLFYFAQAILFADLCRAQDVAHVHVHHANVAADVTLLACEFGRRSGNGPRTWSITIHGPTEFLEPAEYRPGPKARDADLVVVISDHARQTLLAFAGDIGPKLHTVRLGVDLERFRYQPPGGGGPLRVLNVAQLIPRKGQADLIDAVAQLDDVELILVGGGPDRDALEERARRRGMSERLTLRGALGEQDVVPAYHQADVFCLASYAEGLPVVLMEAMASGLPVVATRVAGTPELVSDGESGLLVDPGRPEQIAEALGRVARDPDLRTRLSRAGRAKVEAEHDFHALVKQLYELIGAAGSQPLPRAGSPTSTARG